MPEPARSRLGRLVARAPKLPSERDWERSVLLEPLLAPRGPQLVSDGAGLAFAPTALAGASEPLDQEDPAVIALIAQLNPGATPRGLRARRKRDAPAPAAARLETWRLLARTDDEALFGRGEPPQLLTVAVRQDARRRTWSSIAVSDGRPLRATREGIRASSWRLDPAHPAEPADTVLHVLVREQTFAGSQRAEGRVLPPDLHLDAERLVLTMFVTPKRGFQARAPNPETPVRIALPQAVGARQLIDGALYPPTD